MPHFPGTPHDRKLQCAYDPDDRHHHPRARHLHARRLRGKTCIAGHRIRVQDIYVWHELQGQSVDEIVADFPQITRADVYAALAYLWDNRDAILREIEEGDRFVEEFMKRHPSKLQTKLERIMREREKSNGTSSSF